MCGIVGAVSSFGSITNNVLSRMNIVQSHRGPDSFNQLVSENCEVGLAMSRLAIVDIEGGAQPMASDCRRYTLVFNGQIFNHIDLRAELQSIGVSFKTDSDTELLLNAYILWGVDCLHRFNGFFSFAIHDLFCKKLFIFRDRLGVKPLHYAVINDVFYFGSEVKSLMMVEGFSKEVNRNAVAEYLELGYVLSPNNIFSCVSSINPGSYLEVTYDNDRLDIEEYQWWSLPKHSEFSSVELQDEEFATRLLKDSVRLRLGDETANSLFLSGGIDSGGLAALTREVSNEKSINSYTASFLQGNSEELRLAELISQEKNIKQKVVEIDFVDVMNRLPKIIYHIDQPISDSAVVPTYMLSMAAQPDTKHLLSGVGADEIFLGYGRHHDGLWFDHLFMCLPSILKKLLISIVPIKILKNRLKLNSLSVPERFIERVRIFSAIDIKKLCYGESSVVAKFSAIYSEHESRGKHSALGVLDLLTYLPDNILALTDKVGMAASIEIREPFLDHRVLEYGLFLKDGAKIKNHFRRRGKIILRSIFHKILPQEVFRAKKMGFAGPVGSWCKENGLVSLVAERFRQSSTSASEILDSTAVLDFLEHINLDSISNREANQVWTLLCLEIWVQIFIENIDPEKIELIK